MKMALKDYEGYSGPDIDLEISLFEYGLIWNKQEDGEYHFVHRVYRADVGIGGEWFDSCTMSKQDFDIMVDEDWFEANKFCDFIGCSVADLKSQFPSIMLSVLHYYGPLNIFGDSYTPFEIEGGE